MSSSPTFVLGYATGFEFEKKAGTYINANIPKTFVSRDSTAVAQGIRVPAHLYYEGLAQEYRSRCGAAQDFVKLAKRFLRQLQVQMSGIGIAAGPPLRDVIDIVTQVLKRFHLVSKQLRHRREGRHTLEIHDEYDVQDLLHGLLRLHFDDVRPEEWTPSYAGGAARMDFLLKAEQIVVEAKMTRKNHGAREVSGSVQAQELKKRERRSVEPSHETTERVFAA